MQSQGDNREKNVKHSLNNLLNIDIIIWSTKSAQSLSTYLQPIKLQQSSSSCKSRWDIKICTKLCVNMLARQFTHNGTSAWVSYLESPSTVSPRNRKFQTKTPRNVVKVIKGSTLIVSASRKILKSWKNLEGKHCAHNINNISDRSCCQKSMRQQGAAEI